MSSNAGDLNKRIEIQATTKVSDGMGGYVSTFITLATIWAAIWPTSAGEITAANATSMVISHRIRIRYRSVLKASYRIKFGTRYFSIVGITCPNEGKEFLDIMCKEAA